MSSPRPTRDFDPLPKPASRSIWRNLVPLVVVAFAALTILPTTIVVLVGFVPMAVTLVIDESPGRYLARTVAGMATAAMIPFIVHLWDTGHTIHGAVALVSDVYTWFVIYAAIGIGWLMFMGFPSLVAEFRTYIAQQRIKHLKRQQEELIEEWGESIAEAAPSLAGLANKRASRAEARSPAD